MMIGQTITITTRMKSHVIFDKGFREHTHTGTIIPNPKWLESSYITIRDVKTGETHMIDRSNIVGDMKISDDSARNFKVKSKIKKSEYIVTYIDGKYSCSCIGFSFRRYCKHTKAVEKHINQ